MGCADMQRVVPEYRTGKLPETFRTVFVLLKVEVVSTEETAHPIGIRDCGGNR